MGEMDFVDSLLSLCYKLPRSREMEGSTCFV
jgi:hypothetical protein